MTPAICPRLLVETVHGITVARFTDELIVSEEVIYEVGEQLLELLDGSLSQKVLLNFSEVRGMSSTMLAVLLKVRRAIAAVGGQLKLCCIADDLRQIFRISRFDRLFELHDEEWTALDAF
jgi:anti-sigma B factor antagonist